MNVVDFIIIGIVLLSGILGLRKGLALSLLSLLGWLASLILTFILLDKFINLVDSLFHIKEMVAKFLEPKLMGINEEIFSIAPTEENKLQLITQGLNSAGVPAFISGILAPLISGGITANGMSLAQIIAPAVGNVIVYTVCSIVLFTLLSILVSLISKAIKGLLKNRTLYTADRILGFVFGFARGLVFVGLIAVVFCLISNFDFAKPVKDSVENSYFGRLITTLIYENIVKKINFGDIIGLV